MRIQRIEVQNLRALRASSVNLSGTTAILGENNSGKSAFLLAADLFFSSSPKLSAKDFSDGNIQDPINITLYFSELTPYDREEFEGNLLDGQLVVTRRFDFNNPNENGKYFVSARVNPDFTECRNETRKTEKREIYSDIRANYKNPPELEKEKNADEIETFLTAWETNHPEALKVEKVSAFKGWTNVAAGKLKQKTSYVLIRAVQDAAEDIQGSKSSPVKSLIDAIARQAIENRAEFKTFLKEAGEKISALTDPKNVPVLTEISSGLTGILADYYKDSEIIATWQPVTQLTPAFPSASIEVKDHDFVTGLDGVGHGLQRAVILTVLRFMADYKAREGGSEDGFKQAESDLIIAIEEPEIYQHPTKQRLFAKLLRRLTEGFNAATGIRVQTIFVTHSPLMVSIAQFEGIRMARLTKQENKRNVVIRDISLDRCAQRSAKLCGLKPEEAWSATNYGAKLHTFGNKIAEGFFAKCVVLVEGIGDEAIIGAWYGLNNRDPHAEGIVIAEVTGKYNLDKPIVIFDELGIPCYWIFDNDKSDKRKKATQSVKSNRMLQELGGVEKEQLVDWPEGQFEHFTSWDKNLETYVCDKIGKEPFEKICNEFADRFDIDSDLCFKFPASASGILHKLREDGVKFTELDNILAKIDALVNK